MVYFASKNSRGFTFIESLIVLAMMALLFGFFFYIWNSLEIFVNARDSKRMNDIQLIDSAIKSLLNRQPDLNLGSENIVYVSLPDSSLDCASYSLVRIFSPYSYHCQSQNDYLKIDGNGWLPLDFRESQIIGLSFLPVDPLNNKDYFYAYQVKNGRYKLTAKFETRKYFGKMIDDGGLEPTLYEIGSDIRIPSPHSGLVAYWSFDESTGTDVFDLSGYNYNGILYNSPQRQFGKAGGSLFFNGTDSYVGNLGNFNSTSSLSIALWFKTNSGVTSTLFGQTNNDFSNNPSTSVSVFALKGNGYLRGEFRIGSIGEISTNFAVNDNDWHHAVMVGDSFSQALYVDGNLIGTRSGILQQDWWQYSFIGRGFSSSDGWHFFNGAIDEVRIYNRALSSDEVQVLYESIK